MCQFISTKRVIANSHTYELKYYLHSEEADIHGFEIVCQDEKGKTTAAKMLRVLRSEKSARLILASLAALEVFPEHLPDVFHEMKENPFLFM